MTGWMDWEWRAAKSKISRPGGSHLEIQVRVVVVAQVQTFQGSRMETQAKFLCCSQRPNYFNFQKPQSLLLRPSANEMKSTHIKEG